jgi:protease I
MFDNPTIEDSTVAMIVGQEFEDVEFEYPLLTLSEVGADIVVVPIKRGQSTRPFLDDKIVTGRFGSPCPPDVMTEGDRYTVADFDELTHDDVDCLLFPGGFSPDNLRILDDVTDFVREADERGTLIAAICHAAWILIDAHIAAGRTMTCYRAVREDVKNAGAEYVDAPAVRDGNLISGRVPDDLPQFCALVAEAIAERERQSTPA